MMKNEINPLVSVIMGAYNCAGTLREALDSIRNQTYTNWEIVICDDGSLDNTYEVISEFQERYPEKIQTLRNDINQGLNYTLNRCLSCARGSLIARMDGDDLCDPGRFEREVRELLSDSSIDIVSTDMVYFDEAGSWGLIRHPDEPVPGDFVKGTPFCHAPCMVRKTAFDQVGGYSEDSRTLRVEDYDLWVRMYAAGFRGRNIHEALYSMRDDRNAYSRRKFRYRLNEAYVMMKAVRLLKLPLWKVVYALRPVIVGLLPGFMYDYLHKRRLNQDD